MSINKSRNEHYISEFEENFIEWVEGLSRIVASGGAVQDLRYPIQALVNAYYEEKGGVSVLIPNINTLKLFILISGATESHSGNDENL